VGHLEQLRQPLALGALARAGRSDEDEPHGVPAEKADRWSELGHVE